MPCRRCRLEQKPTPNRLCQDHDRQRHRRYHQQPTNDNITTTQLRPGISESTVSFRRHCLEGWLDSPHYVLPARNAPEFPSSNLVRLQPSSCKRPMRIRRRLLFLTRSRALSGPAAGKGSNCQILTTALPYLAVIGRSRPVREPTLCRPLLFAAISTARLTARDPLSVTSFGSRPSRPRPLLHCGDDQSFPAYKDSAHSPLT